MLRLLFYTGDAVPQILRDCIDNGYTFAAHNAMGFDAEAYRLLVCGPQPAAWYDTLPCARAAGLPGGLDELGKRFAGRGKDELGQSALKLMYTAKVKHENVTYPVGTRPLWQLLLRYNIADVLLLKRVFEAVHEYGEPDVLEAHCTINARGVALDRAYLDQLSNLWAEAGQDAYGKIADLTGGRLHQGNIRSGPQVHKWLKSQGLHLESLNRQQLQQLYDEPEEFFSGDASEADIEDFISPREVRQAAADEIRTANEVATRINGVLQAVRGKYGSKIDLGADWTQLQGFDTFCVDLAIEYPDVIGESRGDERGTMERTWELICAGKLPRADRSKAYRDATDRIIAARMRPAPDEPIDKVHRVVEVLKLRQLATRGSTGKLHRAYELMDADDRIRDWAQYYGAHTGRWSGRGIQPHNFPRGVKIDLDAVIDAYNAGTLTLEAVRQAAPKSSLDDALASLLRLLFVASPGHSLLTVDYGAIEARGIAWVAGQDDLLDLFRRGDDPYCDMASVIFGRTVTKKNAAERQIGKVAVLGAGYSMSARKFAAYCKTQGIDLLAAGVTGESCIKAYRAKNAQIVAIWKAYNAAAFNAVKWGAVDHAGRCDFGMRDGSLVIRLPSGRELIYRDARIEDRVPSYCAALGIPEVPRPTICYTKPHGYEGTLYGGLIAENIVQAICRDLLATSLVKCEAAGLPVVLHVHDEIVCEVPADLAAAKLDQLATIMTTPPPRWAAGFPIAVEGFTSSRYTKSPFRDSIKIERKSAA